MRYNKQELFALASQSSQNFDKEGVLVWREKQDGFFRRAEGCLVRWCRLRGNLLFYLKGPEPWYEPVGVIVLGHHQVKVQAQDDNGHWPFQITWDNGLTYRMATFHESERAMWLKAMQMAPCDAIRSQIATLKESLNQIRLSIDLASYRKQKGIVAGAPMFSLDMNEVPTCELCLACDNLLCDTYGRPPSPLIVIYVKYPKGLTVKYGTTEVIETCSNPSFSKTILFRASDNISGDVIIRIVVYDVKEMVTQTAVPMGYTTMLLRTIQEAQRIRVALHARDNKNVGFVTINSSSLEPSYTGTSPAHANDKTIDIQQKLSHRRSQSLPPRLGVQLKFPSYDNVIRQNFVNSYQVTYRFHSGLGADVTVLEVMAEPKLCFILPRQLLDIYIQRENELLDELLSVGEICGQWQNRQLQLVGTHVSMLKHYLHSKSCLLSHDVHFKASDNKGDPNLQFAPINLHLQRMWVHNDTLNKSGFHDVITVGAFAMHSNKNENTGGLIRLVQQLKDIESSRAALQSAAVSKTQVEYDNIVAVSKLIDETVQNVEKIIVMLIAKQKCEAAGVIEDLKSKVKSMLALWDPTTVEESLSFIGWPKNDSNNDRDNQTMSTIMRLTEQLSMFENDYDNFEISSSTSSKDTSPTGVNPSFSASVPNIPNDNANELNFDNDYFNGERKERILNHSFRSVRSIRPSEGFESRTRCGSLKYDFKSSASLEQVSYRSLIEQGTRRKMTELRCESALPSMGQLDSATRVKNLCYLKSVGHAIEEAVAGFADAVMNIAGRDADPTEESIETVKSLMEGIKSSVHPLPRWLRLAHAAMRLRFESPQWTRENAALQMRRDMCFSQALTTVTTGLLCWLSCTPAEVIVKLLSSGLGPLCGFQGLVTLYSKEKAMWGDMVVAVEDLQTVLFKLVKVGHNNTAIPHVTGSRGALTVQIPVSDSLHSKFTSKEHMTFTITAVFFNIGINDKATLADSLKESLPQQQSNCDNLDRLNKYWHKYNNVFPKHHNARASSSSRTKPLEEVMENLRIAVHKKVSKNVEVLHLTALATRLMNGVRFTSCKSAKDRTGMSVTLEQCSILATEYHLAENEVKKALRVIRSEGCRLENTFKNNGVRKYKFSKKQVMSLPEEYRPPAGTYGFSNNTLI